MAQHTTCPGLPSLLNLSSIPKPIPPGPSGDWRPPMPLSSPAPKERAIQGLPSGLEVGQENDLCLGCPHPVARTRTGPYTHFAIIIKLLADQASLAQPKGSWRKERESRPHQPPMANPQDFSWPLPQLCLPLLLHLPAGGQTPGARKTRAGLRRHPLTSHVTLGNPLNLSEPQSPPWRDNMATSGLGCRITACGIHHSSGKAQPNCPRRGSCLQ